jgi:hypothetical protein
LNIPVLDKQNSQFSIGATGVQIPLNFSSNSCLSLPGAAMLMTFTVRPPSVPCAEIRNGFNSRLSEGMQKLMTPVSCGKYNSKRATTRRGSGGGGGAAAGWRRGESYLSDEEGWEGI